MMIAKCPVCDCEVASGSRFCSACGTPLSAGRTDRGGTLVGFTLIFAGILPGIFAVIGLIEMFSGRRSVSWAVGNAVYIAAMVLFFALVYRGQRWALLAACLLIIANNVAASAIAFIPGATFLGMDVGPASTAFSFIVIPRIAWIGFALFLLWSRDVRAFIEGQHAERS